MRVSFLTVAAAVLCAGMLVSRASYAQDAQAPIARTFSISGAVESPLNLLESDLRRLPPTEVTVSFETNHGQEQGTFRGVLLWSLLSKATIVDGAEKSSHLSHTITIVGRDGYQVALSIGEIEPKFEGKSVILAYDRDGVPASAADGLRLVVPGDRHGGRDVRDVVQIVVH